MSRWGIANGVCPYFRTLSQVLASLTLYQHWALYLVVEMRSE